MHDRGIENARLLRENQALRDTNETLGLPHLSTSEIIQFIDEYRIRFSVEFICETLKDSQASASYRLVIARPRPAVKVLGAIVMFYSLNALVLFIGPGVGVRKCGMLFTVTESISIVSKLHG